MSMHRQMAQMMRAAAPPVGAGIILEDDFTTGTDGTLLAGRVTPVGGFTYVEADPVPITAIRLATTQEYTLQTDGSAQYGGTIGDSTNANDTRMGFGLPSVIETNNFRVEGHGVGYQGTSIGVSYIGNSLVVGDEYSLAPVNGIRVYIYPGPANVNFSYLVNVFKGGVNTEIVRGTSAIPNSTFRGIVTIIERNGDHLFISIDGQVMADGTSYASNMPVSSVGHNLYFYTRYRTVKPRGFGYLKVESL